MLKAFMTKLKTWRDAVMQTHFFTSYKYKMKFVKLNNSMTREQERDDYLWMKEYVNMINKQTFNYERILKGADNEDTLVVKSRDLVDLTQIIWEAVRAAAYDEKIKAKLSIRDEAAVTFFNYFIIHDDNYCNPDKSLDNFQKATRSLLEAIERLKANENFISRTNLTSLTTLLKEVRYVTSRIVRFSIT